MCGISYCLLASIEMLTLVVFPQTGRQSRRSWVSKHIRAAVRQISAPLLAMWFKQQRLIINRFRNYLDFYWALYIFPSDCAAH